MNNTKGSLYLFPMTLGDTSIDLVIPSEVQKKIIETKFLIVENIRTTRRYLKKIDKTVDIDSIHFEELNKHTNPDEIQSFLKPVFEGNNVGIISEAGCPGIADPGSTVVALAHELNIDVIPLTGPSSILMALIASGFNGQQFTFNGYLPKDKSIRKKKLKDLERIALNGTTQLFMETPFRNNQLLEDIFATCSPSIMLTIASEITLYSQFLKTKKVAEWKKNTPDLNKKPTIFAFGDFSTSF